MKVYILTMDLTEQNPDFKPITEEDVNLLRGLYKEKNQESDVIRIDLHDTYIDEFKDSPNKDDFYTPYAFLRLFADKLDLPDKVIYLDTDVVALGDISELYDIDISNYELGMVKDYYGKHFFGRKYCNSGVLLMNMPLLRETKLLQNAMKLCAEKKIFLADQTALNRLIKKKLILDRRFNEQHKIRRNTVLRHFSMTIKFFPRFKKQNIKPWNIEELHNVLKCHKIDDILEKYLEIKNNYDNIKENKIC